MPVYGDNFCYCHTFPPVTKLHMWSSYANVSYAFHAFKKADKQESKKKIFEKTERIQGWPVILHLSKKLRSKGKCHYPSQSNPIPKFSNLKMGWELRWLWHFPLFQSIFERWSGQPICKSLSLSEKSFYFLVNIFMIPHCHARMYLHGHNYVSLKSIYASNCSEHS